MKRKFNLEAALKGKPFECEDGSQVLKWMYCEEAEQYPVVCFVKIPNGEINIKSFTQDGFYYEGNNISLYNLVMSPKKVTRWFNVYRHTAFGFQLVDSFDSEESAKEMISNDSRYITTISVEIEMP
jgi:hypothetical protein